MARCRKNRLISTSLIGKKHCSKSRWTPTVRTQPISSSNYRPNRNTAQQKSPKRRRNNKIRMALCPLSRLPARRNIGVWSMSPTLIISLGISLRGFCRRRRRSWRRLVYSWDSRTRHSSLIVVLRNSCRLVRLCRNNVIALPLTMCRLTMAKNPTVPSILNSRMTNSELCLRR